MVSADVTYFYPNKCSHQQWTKVQEGIGYVFEKTLAYPKNDIKVLILTHTLYVSTLLFHCLLWIQHVLVTSAIIRSQFITYFHIISYNIKIALSHNLTFWIKTSRVWEKFHMCWERDAVYLIMQV
jgi:hypothetical protein